MANRILNDIITLLELILDWSELWATLIPLIVLLSRGRQPDFLKPVIIYLWAALFLHVLADSYMETREYDKIVFELEFGLEGNNILYNVHAVVMFTCFSYFFISLKRNVYFILRVILPLLFIVVMLLNFIGISEEDFFNQRQLSGNLLSLVAYLLLIYCLQYYLSQLRDDVEVISTGPGFWIVTGLSIYVVVNFFVFLFYVPMANLPGSNVAARIWTVHNIAYVIFCIFLTKAFYEPVRHQFS